MKILSFGEILWDVYPDNKYIGGAPLNFAAHIAKLGETSYLFSSVGNDALGASAIEQVEKWHIDNRYISTSNTRETGQCLVTLDSSYVPSYNLLMDVAYDYIPYLDLADDFDVLYFGTLALRGEYNRSSLKRLMDENCFQEIFVDVNIRPPFFSEETVLYALRHATILKISLEEMPVIAQILLMQDTENYICFAKRLSELFDNLKVIIITLGQNGAYAYDCHIHRECLCACAKTDVVSTVGAGDSFSAAFLHRYMQGEDISLCLEYANKIACLVVSTYEAVPDYIVDEHR